MGSVVRKIVPLVALLLMLAGCKTRYIERVHSVPVTMHDTIERVVLHRDSVTLHDSVYIHAVGDTIWHERWHTAYRWRVRVDTMRVYVTRPVELHDTIYTIREVEVPVEVYKQHWWQRLLAWAGGIALAGGAGLAIFKLK